MLRVLILCAALVLGPAAHVADAAPAAHTHAMFNPAAKLDVSRFVQK